MGLSDIMQLLDNLTSDEIELLQQQLNERRRTVERSTRHQMPQTEWVARMRAAAAEIRDGFSDEEWANAERAMNEEYIEPWDENEWKD